MALEKRLREHGVRRSKLPEGAVEKELVGAEKDLETSRNSFNNGDHEWATVQAYYSIFHSARALLYSKGFREKSHRGLLAALGDLYPRLVKQSMLDDFEEAMNLRESANYRLTFSEEGAADVIENAENFLKSTGRLLGHGRRRSAARTRQCRLVDE